MAQRNEMKAVVLPWKCNKLLIGNISKNLERFRDTFQKAFL